MGNFPKRHAISRARFFLDLARGCSIEERDAFEAYLEASIIFARTALLRLYKENKNKSNWKSWWEKASSEPLVKFFQKERNYIVHERPPKVGQIIGAGPKAANLYYYENPQTPATDTVEKHLDAIETLLIEAKSLFSES
jgi:hypothetical protein